MAMFFGPGKDDELRRQQMYSQQMQPSQPQGVQPSVMPSPTMPQQQGGMQPPIGLMAQGAGKLMGGGAAAGGGEAAGAAGAASAWPAALVAAIGYNESRQGAAGNRPKNFSKQVKEGLTGESLQRDAKRYGDKVGGPLGKSMEILGQAGNPRGLGRLLEKGLKPWEWF